MSAKFRVGERARIVVGPGYATTPAAVAVARIVHGRECTIRCVLTSAPPWARPWLQYYTVDVVGYEPSPGGVVVVAEPLLRKLGPPLGDMRVVEAWLRDERQRGRRREKCRTVEV